MRTFELSHKDTPYCPLRTTFPLAGVYRVSEKRFGASAGVLSCLWAILVVIWSAFSLPEVLHSFPLYYRFPEFLTRQCILSDFQRGCSAST